MFNKLSFFAFIPFELFPRIEKLTNLLDFLAPNPLLFTFKLGFDFPSLCFRTLTGLGRDSFLFPKDSSLDRTMGSLAVGTRQGSLAAGKRQGVLKKVLGVVVAAPCWRAGLIE